MKNKIRGYPIFKKDYQREDLGLNGHAKLKGYSHVSKKTEGRLVRSFIKQKVGILKNNCLSLQKSVTCQNWISKQESTVRLNQWIKTRKCKSSKSLNHWNIAQK